MEQTYQNLEIIVIDDGSTDNTKKEVDKFDDKRIKYIKLNNNNGATNARNIGIKNAKGSYISFQDSDDIFYPNKLEKQLKNIINKKSDLDFCKIKVILSNSHIKFFPNKRQEKSISSGNIFNELISKGNFISTQAILVKTDFVKKFYFDPNMPRLQDYELILRMIPKVKISYTKNILVEVYRQKDSISSSSGKYRKAIHILLTKQFNFNRKQKLLFRKYLRSF